MSQDCSPNPNQSNITQVIRFLDTVWTTAATGHYLLFDDNKTSHWDSVARRESLAEKALELNSAVDVWGGCCLRREPLGNGKRGGTMDVCAVPGLWLDVDFAGSVHKSDKLPAENEANLWVEGLEVQPTLVVNSGHGLQLWWLFNEPQYLHDDFAIRKAQLLSSDFFTTLNQSAKGQGWTLDNVSDLARIMRIPGTVNRKSDPVPVTLLKADGPRYLREDLLRFIAKVGASGASSSVPQSSSTAIAMLKADSAEMRTEEEIEQKKRDITLAKRCLETIAGNHEVVDCSYPGWLRMMYACWHVDPSDDMMNAFDEFSKKVPGYKEGAVETKWKKHLTGGGAQKVTLGSLIMLAREADPSFIVPDAPFPTQREVKARQDEVVEALNKTYAVVRVGGKAPIMALGVDKRGQRTEDFLSAEAFHLLHSNKFCIDGFDAHGEPKYTTLSKYWLKNTQRREYKGYVFQPEGCPPDYYNSWQGFAVEPKEGDCSLYLNHVREVICDGDKNLYNYVMAWLSDAVTNFDPRNKPGTALILKGPQGAGKGQFAQPLGAVFGKHFTHLADSSALTGKFNAPLAECMLLFCDEAFFAGDKAGVGRLKNVVTESHHRIEKKGFDSIACDNYVHLIAASNNEWVVPAESGERRWIVLNVNGKYKGNRVYFDKLANQMRGGGTEALLHHLINYDAGPSALDLRTIPRTCGLLEQIEEGLDSVDKWWFQALQIGCLWDAETPEIASVISTLEGRLIGHDGVPWNNSVPSSIMYLSYIAFCKNINERRPVTCAQMIRRLRRNGGLSGSHAQHRVENKRQWCYETGDMKDARANFERYIGQPVPWDE